MSEKDRDLLVAYLKALETQNDRLEDKVDTILIKQNNIEVQLSRNTDSLIKHEHRTHLSEKRLAQVEIHITRVNTILDFLKPTKAKLLTILIVAAFAFGVIDLNSPEPVIKQVIQLIK